jgi:hypothetical protein
VYFSRRKHRKIAETERMKRLFNPVKSNEEAIFSVSGT